MNAISDDVIKLLREQEKFENETAERLQSLMERINNNVVKLLLNTMVLDSKKHASIIHALLELTQGIEFVDADKYLLKKELSSHIAEEEDMLGKVREIAEKVEDNNVKSILDQISLEEERHHTGLRQLLPILDKAKIVGDDEWWEYMNQWANFST